MILSLVLCACDVVGLAVGVVLALRMPWRGAVREALHWGMLIALALLAAVVVTRPWGGFGTMRAFCHVLFCIALPVLAVRAVRIRRHSRWLAALLLVTFIGGEACYVFAREIEPFRLEITTERVTSPRLATLDRPVRVALVADLQTDAIGAYEVSVFDRLVELEPDLVLFLGDYLQLGRREAQAELPALHAQIARLAPRLGMFAVDGNVDGPAGGAEGVFAGTAVRVLHDELAALEGASIDLVGLSVLRSSAPFADAVMLRRMRGERFPIVLGHAPDFMQSVLRGGLDVDALMVAGHTHGGQVQVPGFGPLITLSSVPRWLAGGGVFQRGQTWLCCSRGIGMERGSAPRVRFWCRPQLIVLELSGAAGAR